MDKISRWTGAILRGFTVLATGKSNRKFKSNLKEMTLKIQVYKIYVMQAKAALKRKFHNDPDISHKTRKASKNNLT